MGRHSVVSRYNGGPPRGQLSHLLHWVVRGRSLTQSRVWLRQVEKKCSREYAHGSHMENQTGSTRHSAGRGQLSLT